MSMKKLDSKIRKNAINRELMYVEAQEKVIASQRKASKTNEKKKVNQFQDVKSLFYSFSHTTAKSYQTLYYKTLSRNHILDISDESPGSPFMMLSPSLKSYITTELLRGPHLEDRDIDHVFKHIRSIKHTKRGLKLSLDGLKKIKDNDRDISASVSVLKFLIKKHIEEDYLFNNLTIKAYSECDYVIKFWGPLIEKVFKKSSIIPHWGDTIPGSLLSLGVQMKMDLRLVAVPCSKELRDHGYGEIAKEVSFSKYFKDKRKTVVAAKALINSILNKSLEMSRKLYVTKKLKTITFPSNLDNFSQEAVDLVNGLLDLVEICNTIKIQACKGTKRRSIDTCIGGSKQYEKEHGTTKVVWDDVDESEFEDEVEDDEDEEDVDFEDEEDVDGEDEEEEYSNDEDSSD